MEIENTFKDLEEELSIKIVRLSQDTLIDDIIKEKNFIIQQREIRIRELESDLNSLSYKVTRKLIKILKRVPYLLPTGKWFLKKLVKR